MEIISLVMYNIDREFGKTTEEILWKRERDFLFC